MLKKVWIRYLAFLLVAVVITIVTLYPALKDGAVELADLIRGFSIGAVVGCGISVIFIKDLKGRLQGNIIQKIRSKELVLYSLLIVAIVFYPEIGGLFCRLFGIQDQQSCLSLTNGAFYGIMDSIFIIEFIWVMRWGSIHKQPLYFQ